MTQLFVNNFSATVAQTFGAADQYLYLSGVAGLPALTGGNHLVLTLFRKVGIVESGHEVIKVTAITDNMLTVVRAVEGAAATLFNVGDHVEARVTAAALGAKADLANPTFTGTVGGITAAMVGAPAGSGNSSGNNTGDQDLSGKQNVLVSGTNIKTVNGQSLLGGGDLALASTSLSGNTTIYVGQVIAYTITDFDSFSTYAVAVSAGSVTRTLDAISFTAPAVAGNVTLTVTTNGVARAITLVVLAASVVAPTITSPANAATGVLGPAITLTSNAFAWLGVADTHLNSDWQLATDAAFTSIVQSVSASATYKTSWSTTVAVGTMYYARVRHRGTANGASSYSATVTFSTAATFNSYITTPTATPAAFGDSFEGGFYTGQIWNELVQSASSYAIGTGSKAFVVADMTATPLVYAGQTLEVRSRANPVNKMIGVVTGASGTALTINVTSVGGSGTFTDWSIMAQYRVIVAPKATGENTAIAYKNANTAAPAACGTLSEGRKATLAMVAADTSTVYPAAHWCNNLSIAGKTDWYLPARDELELCWRNLKPTADANYVTADRPVGATPNYMNLGSYGDTAATHGLDNNSSPVGAAHISGTPAQVAAGKNFRTSESEAFAYGSFFYWSASEYSATVAWVQLWHSPYPGNQSGNGKAVAVYVRAVRRSII